MGSLETDCSKITNKLKYPIEWNAFENIVCNMRAMLFVPECIDDK